MFVHACMVLHAFVYLCVFADLCLFRRCVHAFAFRLQNQYVALPPTKSKPPAGAGPPAAIRRGARGDGLGAPLKAGMRTTVLGRTETGGLEKGGLESSTVKT